MLPSLHTRGVPGCLHANALSRVRSPVIQPARCIAQMHCKVHVYFGSRSSSVLHERFAGCKLAGRTLHQVRHHTVLLQGHRAGLEPGITSALQAFMTLQQLIKWRLDCRGQAGPAASGLQPCLMVSVAAWRRPGIL